MNFIQLKQPPNNIKPGTGKLLIADPFLQDPGFSRSVVLLCDHSDKGDVGFILNQITNIQVADILPATNLQDISMRIGGPVQTDSLQMLHRMPDVLGGFEISQGLFWGGSYEALQDLLVSASYDTKDIFLFLGYSGWTHGQLEQEIAEGSWIISDSEPGQLLDTPIDKIWQMAVRNLGKDFEYIANMPVDPSLN